MTTPATCATQAASEGLDTHCLAMQVPLQSRAVLQVFPCCCLPGRPGGLQRGSHAAKFLLPAPHPSACSARLQWHLQIKKKLFHSRSFPTPILPIINVLLWALLTFRQPFTDLVSVVGTTGLRCCRRHTGQQRSFSCSGKFRYCSLQCP